MADLTKTVDVILNGEDRMTATFRRVTQASYRLGGALGTAGGVAAGAGVAAAALATVGTVASGTMAKGLASAYQQSITFEAAMKDLEKVLGDQPELLNQAKQAAMEMSNTYGVSSTKIVDSIASWVQAGYDLRESMTLAEDAISLTYASELDMAQATDAMTRVMKGFKIEADDTRRKLDAINAISNNYATNVGMMTEALGRAAPVAESVGLSLEQMASLMAPTIEAFQNGQRAGTAWRTMLTRVQDDTKSVQEALNTLGVSQKTANGQFKSGSEILYDVGEAFQGLNENQKSFVAQQLMGREHASKFLATMSSWDQVSEVYNTAMDSAGSITEEVNNRLEAGQTQVDRFSAAWENLAVSIGDRFRSSVTEAVTSATDLVDAIQTGIQDGALDDFFSEIGDMARELAGYLDEIAAVMPQALAGVDWSGLADSVRGVGDAFKGWFEDVDLTTTEGLSSAIQDIADGTAKLIGLFEALVAMADDIAGFGADVGAVAQEIMEHSTATENAAYSVRDLGVAARSTSPQAQKLAEALRYAKDHTSGASNEMDQFNQYLNYNTRNTHKSKKALGELQYVINTLTGKQLIVGAEADKKGARKAGEEAKDQIPEKTKMTLETQVEKKNIEKEIAEIEAAAEKAQKALEMEAKVEIAQAEAQAEKVKSAFESVNSTVKSSTKQMETLFGFLKSPGQVFSPSFYRDVQDMVTEEQEKRMQVFEKQAKLLEQQAKLMKARAEAMEDGDALIKVDGEGLQPHLEAFMWEILEQIQVRVNEQGMGMLLGSEA